jgi:hypothetical protein
MQVLAGGPRVEQQPEAVGVHPEGDVEVLIPERQPLLVEAAHPLEHPALD